MKNKPGGIFIAAGSNLGDRAAHILGGLRDLENRGDIRVLQRSTLREYPPVGGPANQPPYLNAVAEISTTLEPRELLQRLHDVEALHGRIRAEPNGPRTLDLDLVLYGARVIREADLAIPHPRMMERSFVVDPLREIGGPAAIDRARRLLSADAALQPTHPPVHPPVHPPTELGRVEPARPAPLPRGRGKTANVH